MLYYPTQVEYIDSKRIPSQPENVYFPLDDQTQLHGWYFKNRLNRTPKSLVLFFHGNAQNLTSHFLALYWLLDHGHDFFIFDYPGYGKSQGKPDPNSTVKSGVKALEWALTRAKGIPVAVYSQSLGGTIGLRSIIDGDYSKRLCLIVADSTFLSYQGVANHILSRSWLTWPFQWLPYLVLSDKMAPEKKISNIAPTQLVVVHGDQDSVVDYKLGLQLYSAAKDPKEFWPIPGGEHIQTFSGLNHLEMKNKFIKSLDQNCPRVAIRP